MNTALVYAEHNQFSITDQGTFPVEIPAFDLSELVLVCGPGLALVFTGMTWGTP